MTRPSDFETYIHGRLWSVTFVRRGDPKLQGGNWGICYWTDAAIYVRYDLSQANVKMVLIHELLHATCKLMYEAEGWVDQTANELAAALDLAGM